MKVSKYLEFTRLGVNEGFQYRANALSGILSTFISLTLFYYVWKAIASSGELAQPFPVIIGYVALAQVINNSTSANLESWVGDRIRRGTIVNELKRPVSLKLQLYFYQVGKSMFKMLTRGLPAMIIGIIFLNVGIPGVVGGLKFLVSIFLTLNIVVGLSYTTSMIVFFTKIDTGLRMIRATVSGLLSGAMIPLYLLPGNLRQIFYLTPFPSMVDAPISIYQGTGNFYEVVGLQLFWIIALFLTGELLWRKAKKKLTVQGG